MTITLSVPPFPYPPAAPVLTRAASVRVVTGKDQPETMRVLAGWKWDWNSAASRDDVQPSVLDMIGGEA